MNQVQTKRSWWIDKYLVVLRRCIFERVHRVVLQSSDLYVVLAMGWSGVLIGVEDFMMVYCGK